MATVHTLMAVETNSLEFKAEPLSNERPPDTGWARRRARPAYARPDKTSPNRGILPFSKAIPDLVE
jgi:hypothetical protein